MQLGLLLLTSYVKLFLYILYKLQMFEKVAMLCAIPGHGIITSHFT
jgi:hypothetical protein